MKRMKVRETEGRKGKGEQAGKPETEPELEVVSFLCSRGLFVKAVFRVTGLAPSASTVTGNYKQAKCVTCPNTVVESLRGHRAQAGCQTACRNLYLVTDCATFFVVLLCGTSNSAPAS